MRSCEEHEFKKKNMKEKWTLREFLAKMEKENDKMATCKTMIKMVNPEVTWCIPIGINWVRMISLNFEKIWSLNLIESY